MLDLEKAVWIAGWSLEFLYWNINLNSSAGVRDPLWQEEKGKVM